MPGSVLLDTSILIAVLRDDPGIADRLEATEEAYASVITLGELLFGAQRSGRAAENRARVDAMAWDSPCGGFPGFA